MNGSEQINKDNVILSIIDQIVLLFYVKKEVGDQVLREQSILALDNILKQDSVQTSRKVVEFYHAMLDHMQIEFPGSVTSTVIWLVYNHGFVIKTPRVTLAFDLITGYSGTDYHPLFEILKEQIKLMFSATSMGITMVEIWSVPLNQMADISSHRTTWHRAIV